MPLRQLFLCFNYNLLGWVKHRWSMRGADWTSSVQQVGILLPTDGQQSFTSMRGIRRCHKIYRQCLLELISLRIFWNDSDNSLAFSPLTRLSLSMILSGTSVPCSSAQAGYGRYEEQFCLFRNYGYATQLMKAMFFTVSSADRGRTEPDDFSTADFLHRSSAVVEVDQSFRWCFFRKSLYLLLLWSTETGGRRLLHT